MSISRKWFDLIESDLIESDAFYFLLRYYIIDVEKNDLYSII